jgi:hypothetical protein
VPIRDSVVLITAGAIRVGRCHALTLDGAGAYINFGYVPGEGG